MNRAFRKFIALFMLFWLPLFSASAFAATIPMQLHGDCHDVAAMSAMQHDGMGMHHQDQPVHDQHDVSCNAACDICHVACAGCLAVQAVDLALHQQEGIIATHFLVSFTSFTSAPLDPPPLARS